MKAIIHWPIVLLISFAASAAAGYQVINRLPLGGEGGWDYVTADGSGHRLYLSHGTHVMVLDTETNTLVGDIPDTPGVHGVALAPELSRGFTSNGKANTASIFDLKTLRVMGQVHTGENPDAILYDPHSRRVFTFNGKSKDATVFDAESGKVLSTINLGGKPEFAVTDNTGTVLVNIEDTNELVELDSTKLTVTKRHSLAPCNEPTGMAIDPEHHRVFSVCRNKLMTVYDLAAGKMLATVPIGEGADGSAFDGERGIAFSSNGEGTLTLVRETSPGRFESQTVATKRGARTMALDPITHRVYLPTAEFGPAPPPTEKTPRPRPPVIKDSFEVLVVGE